MDLDTPLRPPGEATLLRLLGPFDAAMALVDTREIVVIEPGAFGVEGGNGWSWHEDPRLTFRWLDALGRLAGRMTHQDLSSAMAACSSRLPGGQRITVAMPPVVPDGTINLTIRQRAKSFNPTLDWLDDNGWFRFTQGTDADGQPWTPAEGWKEWLRAAVVSGKNIVFDGAIGSSKTTGSEAAIKEIPIAERIGTFESVPEWDFERPNWVPVRYAQERTPGVGLPTAEEALQMGLRMRLDRILFGELRTGEAWAWLRALQTGLRGAIATCHGERGFDGICNALIPMIYQAPASAAVPEPTIRDMLRNSVDVVIHCQRVDQDNDGVPYRCAYIDMVPKQ